MKIFSMSLWMALFAASCALVVIGGFVGMNGVKTSIYLALGFLTFTLVPIHFKKLVKYRRDFGITAGMLIALHGVLASWTYLQLSFNNVLQLPIVGGFVGALIIVSMLITSNYVVQRKLKNAWKVVHALVWFMLPLAFMHANLAAQGYLSELPLVAAAVLGGLALFGMAKLALSKLNMREGLRDAALVAAGGIFNWVLLLIYT